MIVQQALSNITIVVEEALMNGKERDQLRADITFVAQRCRRADELEKQITEQEAEKKKPEEPNGN